MDTKQAIEHIVYILAFAFVAWRWARNGAALRRSRKANSRKADYIAELEGINDKLRSETRRAWAHRDAWRKHTAEEHAARAEAHATTAKWWKRALDEKASHRETCQQGLKWVREVEEWVRQWEADEKRLTKERDKAREQLAHAERRCEQALASGRHWSTECLNQADHIGRIRDAWDSYAEALRKKGVTDSHIDKGGEQDSGAPATYALFRLRAAIRSGQDAEGQGDAGGSVQVPEGAPEGGPVRAQG